MPPPGGAAPNWQANYPRGGYAESTPSADGLAIASLVVGILSLLGFCVCYVAVPGGVLALVLGGFGLKGRNRAMAISGMICGGFGIVISLGMFAFFMSLGNTFSK